MFSSNMPAASAPRAKRAPRPPRTSPQGAAVKKIALTKPLAPLTSTKPSDTPMAQAMMKMGRPTAPLAPVPIMPKITPKPASSRSKQTLTTRPKMGMK